MEVMGVMLKMGSSSCWHLGRRGVWNVERIFNPIGEEGRRTFVAVCLAWWVASLYRRDWCWRCLLVLCVAVSSFCTTFLGTHSHCVWRQPAGEREWRPASFSAPRYSQNQIRRKKAVLGSLMGSLPFPPNLEIACISWNLGYLLYWRSLGLIIKKN